MKTRYCIQGMHCRSCELLIEDEIKQIPGVHEVSVNHKAGIADVYSVRAIPVDAIGTAVGRAGYRLGKDEKPPVFSKNPADYRDIGIALMIAGALFFGANALGLFHMTGASGGSYSNLWVVFVIGVTAGVSTCMALVGGLVLGASAKYSLQHPEATGIQKFTPHMYFNAGRIISYFALGAVVGLAGSFFQLSTTVLGILTVVVGLVMLILGSQLVDIFPFMKKVSITLPKGISRAFGIGDRQAEVYSNKNAAVLGAMTFFLPCGFTQAMQLYAMSTGDPLQGSLTLGVFAIGTSPGLLGIGGLSAAIGGRAATLFFKTAGVVVIMLSVFNLSNGMNLLGVSTAFAGIFPKKPAEASAVRDPNVTIENGVQVVRMTQDTYGYKPNSFTIQKDIPTKWIVTSTDTYTCAASIIAQSIGVRAGLKKGENVFEFTPRDTGTIRFTCSMGMMTGSFTVVQGSGSAQGAVTDLSQLQNRVPQPTAVAIPAGGSCGSGGCGCGGGARAQQPPVVGKTADTANVQLLQATYKAYEDITPNAFTVTKNKPVRFEIEAFDDGFGCMGSITLPGLVEEVDILTKGKTTIFEFTPTTTGQFPITCAMGMPRGQIVVN